MKLKKLGIWLLAASLFATHVFVRSLAAEEAIALTGWAGSWPVRGDTGAAAWGAELDGMTIFSPQEGQVISEPAPVLSTASSCSHLGQLKMMSIGLNVGW